jgi:2-polyprenyl-3-methyl-5-hydroxy-6-metoxy-1,4-benzoquinol methylase
MNLLHKNCLICSNENLVSLKGFSKFSLVSCSNCGFVFMQQIPTAQELAIHYNTYSYDRDQYLSPITIKNYNILLDEFEKYRSSNRLLDVGCGMGFFLEQAKKRGWEVYGTEYSPKAIEINQAKGINMVEGQLNSAAFPAKDFDVITSFEVIEHINNPVEEVKHINTLLRKGGLLYCTTL